MEGGGIAAHSFGESQSKIRLAPLRQTAGNTESGYSTARAEELPHGSHKAGKQPDPVRSLGTPSRTPGPPIRFTSEAPC